MIAGAWLCLLAPLAGALLITLAGTRISRAAAAWISTGSVFLGFAGAVDAFIRVLGESPEDRTHLSTAYTWVTAGSFKVSMQILVDPVSLTMMLIVTGVGGLIVWYSMGYMKGEDEERRYFAYMALFVFAMLMLVMGGNLLLLLVGWGLVGLASYLLIGFYHERPEAVAAAKKAFLMNAIGDATMALGFFLLIAKTGTLAFPTEASAGALSSSTANLVALGLLGGAIAKSAQLPLHTWLPDAMEGPTPVSALIHAATMVTAGVYLIVRTHLIFQAAPDVQHLSAVLGGITIVVAGVIALVQWDIKRVIAYSTMSQIGYMFLAAGLGAYGYAMFHLMTHAFFKALLFLSAGVIIHHLAGEQDIRKMGGLRKVMPFTHAAFLVGALALAGIPPLSGFWSKDGIIASSFAEGGVLGYSLFALALLGALLTGAYTFRLYFLVFHGPPSDLVLEHAGGHGSGHAHGTEGAEGAEGHGEHAHGEGPPSMLIPVGILTVLAAIGGLLVIPGVWEPFLTWIDSVAEPLVTATPGQDYATSVLAVSIGGIGIWLAWRAFVAGRELVATGGIRTALEHKLYFDELYDAVFSRPAQLVANLLRERVEEPVVQGSLPEIGAGVEDAADGTARLQSGLLRSYALVVAASVAVLVVVFVAVR